MSASNYIHLDDVKILKETDRAFLIEIEEGQFWIPFTQISDPDDYVEGDENVSMSITEWIAEKAGIA